MEELTIPQAAERFSVPRATVWWWVKTDRLRVRRIGARVMLVRADDVERIARIRPKRGRPFGSHDRAPRKRRVTEEVTVA